MGKKRKLAHQVAVWITCSVFMTQTGLSMAVGPIMPDRQAPNQQQPLVMETANGIPLVQIAAPNAKGISHNLYTDFNVPAKGAILNNSYRMSQTKLAGQVQGNPNLVRGTARLIINEVTSNKLSQLTGYTEVAGKAAGVIIANPNGIRVDGAGFINVPNATLVTGRPTFDTAGNLNTLDVRGGAIAINGKGLDGREQESLRILSRAIAVNAGVWAKDLVMRTGANTIRYSSDDIVATTTPEGERPEMALDVAAIGGMYANRIFLVGSERGLGVNMAGRLSSTKVTAIDVNGDIHVSGVMQAEDMTMHTPDAVTISGHTYSTQDTTVTGNSLKVSGLTAAGHDLTVSMKQGITNTGAMGAGVTAEGVNSQAGSAILRGALITHEQAKVVAGSAIRMEGNALIAKNSEISSQGAVAITTRQNTAQDATTQGQQAFQQTTLSAKDDVTIKADGALTTTDSRLITDGNLTMTSQQDITMKNSLATTGASMTVQATEAIQQANSHVYAAGNVAATAGTVITNEEGTVIAKGHTTLTAPDQIRNTGTMGAGIDETGALSKAGDLTVQAAHVVNDTGALYAGRDMGIQATTVSNTKQGQVIAARDVTVKASQHVVNTAGTIASDRDVTVTTGDVQLDGRLSAGRDLTIATKADITNRTSADGQGVTQAGHNVTIQTPGTFDSVKPIEAGGTASVTAKKVVQQEAATLNAQDVAITADEVTNEALITASHTVTVTATNTLDNREGGRIYGDAISVTGGHVINHRNQREEDRVATEVARLRTKEAELQAVFDRDITAFHSDEEERQYLAAIDAATKAYDEQKVRTDEAIAAMERHQSGTIAARQTLRMTVRQLDNRAKGLLYSGDNMNIAATEGLHNDGATIEAMGSLTLKAPVLANTNETFSVKRVIVDSKLNPLLLRPEEGPERGQTFLASEFDNTGSGYGTSHTRGHYKELKERAEYITVRALTEEERAAGDEPPNPEDIGKVLPSYDYDDPIFSEMGVTPMNRPRPTIAGPEQEQWDAENKLVFEALNKKIDAYNEAAIAYNKSVGTYGTYAVHPYTYIRTHSYTSQNKVQSNAEATIRSGGAMHLDGAVTNENSRIVAGGTLTVNGPFNNVETANRIQTDTFGTTQFSYTYKRKWPHKSRRRAYKAEVFKTPERSLTPGVNLGVTDVRQNTGSTPTAQTITDRRRNEVAGFLDPFGVASPSTPGVAVGTPSDEPRDIRGLITSSLYTLNPSSTADYLIETDRHFTDAKAFLGSDYMYRQLQWEPEHTHKRLGDAFYEQELIRNQILNQTGRRYLEGYQSDEDEFKALMDAGIAFAKAYNLKPGISLTKEQMAALTSDIVWLDTMTVMVNGQPKKVVYPRVYTRANRPMTLQTDGALISASNLVINTKGAVANTGTLLGDTIVMQADRLQQGGYIQAKALGVTTVGDIVNTGTLDATDRVQLVAGRDVVLNNTVTHLANQDVLTTMAGIAVSGEDGVLLLSANRDVKLAGATLTALGTKSQLAIGAGRNVALTTDTLKAKQDMTQDSNNYLRTYRQTEVGTDIRGHDVTILAKQDLTGRATIIQGTGEVRLGAGTALTLTSGESISKDNFGAKYKVSGFLSSTTTTMTRDSEHRQVAGSVVTGRTVTMESGQDMNLTAATIVGTEATALRAGGSVTATSAEQYDHEASMLSVKKSGLMGSGLGFMIGTQKTTDTALGEGLTQVGTVIGSSKGTVVVAAGKDIHLTSSDVVGQEGIRMEGATITLDGKENTSHERYTHEVSSSGLTVSLGGAVVSAATTAVNYLQQAGDRKDARLAALETLEAGKSLREGLSNVKNYTQFTEAGLQSAYQGAANQAMQSMTGANVKALAAQESGSLWSAQTAANATDQAANATALSTKANDTAAIKKEYADQKAAKRDNLLNIHVGIGSSRAQSVTDVKETRYAGGTIASTDGAVQLWARGNDSENGNLTAIGQRIQGKTVELQATGNSNLLAGTNTMHITEDSKSSGWSVGASIGTTGFLGADLSLSKATSEGLTDRVTHTGTTVVGTDAVTVTSGKDTTISGSTVSGQTVTATVGGNLTISSLQDTDTYIANSRNSSLSVGFSGAGITSAMPYTGKENTESTYESVTKQAGIYAGTGGYDITVAGNTGLTGALIDSFAVPDKNSLSTGTLALKDMDNTAAYESSYRGIGYTYDPKFKEIEKRVTEKGFATAEEKQYLDDRYNKVGLVPDLGMHSKGSASSTTKSAIAPGRLTVTNQEVNIEAVNRNTKNTLNELGKIFDKKKVEERQELAKLFAKNANEAIHKISESKGWNDGSAEKVALHSFVAGITTKLGGNSFAEGALAGGVNEAAVGKLMESIGRDNPDMVQMASAVLGYATNKLAGKDEEVGAAVAQWGTKWNSTHKRLYIDGEIVVDQNENWWIYYDGEDHYIPKPPAGTIFLRMSKTPGEGEYGYDYILNEDGSSTYIQGEADKSQYINQWATYKLKEILPGLMAGGLGRGGLGNKGVPISVGIYKMTPGGYFGTKGNSGNSAVRHLPGGKEEAKQFFDTITMGFIDEYWDGNTQIRVMDDGTHITYREESKSDGTPAVDIGQNGIYKKQKIHFEK